MPPAAFTFPPYFFATRDMSWTAFTFALPNHKTPNIRKLGPNPVDVFTNSAPPWKVNSLAFWISSSVR